ncbi:MAG: hypothetical protein JSS96_12560, partial [Bacteroidetes bacterium]|nr:hypothetical protein [Bacteroidota bacterium]
MKKLLPLICMLVSCLPVFGQLKDNDFRNSNNAQYWQNKKPYADYWQQDVDYVLTGDMDEQRNMIKGSELLTYWNNSPDTLYFVYFHLFQ